LTAAEPIKLHLLEVNRDEDEQPRAALVLPAVRADGNAPGRRAVTLVFASVAAAVAEKRRREGATA
jgi:hypothetical protein